MNLRFLNLLPEYGIPLNTLALFRIAFGLSMSISLTYYITSGQVAGIYVDPPFDTHYGGFSWVKPLPGTGMPVLFAVLAMLSLLIAVGLMYRWAIGLFTIGFTYVFLSQAFFFLNHFYLICTIAGVMFFIPCHLKWSFDAKRATTPLTINVSSFNLWALRGVIAIPYVFGGIAKIDADWLRGEPMRLWLTYEKDFPLIGSFFDHESAAYLYSWGGLAFDLLIIPGLLWSRTRVFAILIALGFHLSNAIMFNIGVFPWLMAAALILFINPRRKIIGREAGDEAKFYAMSPVLKWGLIVFFLIQILLPFRHWMFFGNPSWNGQGHKFAWRMMIKEKVTEMGVFVIDRDKKVIGELNPDTLLHRHEKRKIYLFPDLIRQFAIYIRSDLENQGMENFELRFLCISSLNRRKFQLLVDPAIDLSLEKYEPFKSADWIVPLYEPFDRGEVDWSKVPERYKKFKIPEYSRETGQIPYREFYIHLMHEMGWEDQLLPEKAEGQFGAGSGEDGAEPKP